MFDKINRPYKENQAEETIQTAKNILKEMGLMPEENFYANPYPGIFSVSVQLDENKGGFRANGKGRNDAYCLASAYAEFLERMQNGLYAVFSRTMIGRLKDKFGFYYSPDEKFLAKEAFLSLPGPIIADLVRYEGKEKEEFINSYFNCLSANRIPGIVSIPFFDTINNKVEYLPLNLLLLSVGSNGMAAGNTMPEALFQALCELLERWGAACVFYERLTPPTIPQAFLEQFEEEYEIIRSIEASGKYTITIKDFSAGKRIPALGIIIQNKEAGTYRLNVGADTCFQVALSRCLTEVYQGVQNEEQFDKILLSIPGEAPPCFQKDDEFALFQRSFIFGEFTKDNSGIFPPTLFSESPDYQFDPTVFTSQSSYEKEVKALIRFFHNSGHNVYLRNVSFLGFPSVFVYVPEVSAQGRKNAPVASKDNFFNLIELDKLESLFFGLENADSRQLGSIAEILSKFNPNVSITGLFNVKLKNGSWWEELNVAFLLTQIWYKLEEYGSALNCFEQFLDTRPKEITPYYKMVRQYLQLKAEKKKIKEIKEFLHSNFADNKLADEVLQDFSEPEEIFRHVKLPRCPDCRDCKLNEECLTRYKMEMSETIYRQMSAHQPNQKALSWVIEEKASLRFETELI